MLHVTQLSVFIGLAYMGDVIARTKCGEGEGRSGTPPFYRQHKLSEVCRAKHVNLNPYRR